ncbi:sel1 repeat family protein [Alteromonas sp. ASW11-130]|uniref:sel1 repeat family protein n=1 Tax=Alteromonas sp. ASW11-130 TaxID=3015775 RepID=UPI002241B5B3|nr:sel1 repeat family protein [Alteromonas sp. ASW11-130]MCW8092149.1 sel1 repeat family protein [Alteromonas sp. ASW11-130]
MRGFFLALALCLLLASDSGRQPSQLFYNANFALHSGSLLWLASKVGHSDAQASLIDFSVQNEEPYWLKKLVALGHPEAAWSLHRLLANDESDQTLVRLAARGNVPEAQLAFAMATDDALVREKWLKKAASNNYLPAQAALADWYLLHGKVNLARPLLEKTQHAFTQSAFYLGRILIDEGKQNVGIQALQRAFENGHPDAKNWLTLIKHYPQREIDALGIGQWPATKQCKQRIQVFATSLATTERANAIYNQFVEDSRFSTLPICLQKPIRIKADKLNCTDNWRGSGRLGCDVRPLSLAVKTLDITHAVIIHQTGKANVDNGLMYLDLTDSYDVFIHELAHFAGFIDEYPITRNMANRYCNRQEAPNLIFDGELTYSPLATLKRWQERPEFDGIWPAKTCQYTDVQAYKPTGDITFLEHHDSGKIPTIYLTLWKQQLEDPTTSRPIYMNLFQSFHRNGQQTQADIWLRKYEQYKRTPTYEAIDQASVD